MHLHVTLRPLSHDDRLLDLRSKYLSQLPECQELLLEVMVPQASAFELITRKGKSCGYVLVHQRDTVLEFFLEETYWLFGEAVLLQVVRELGLRRAFIKSYDALLLSGAIAHHETLKTVGLLVRDYIPRQLPNLTRICYTKRIATERDIATLRAVRQDVFDDSQRLAIAVQRGLIRIFETPEGQTIGFGILQPIVSGQPHVDVSIALDEGFRRRGHAPFLLQDLAEECLEGGRKPVCGCAVDNLASRHMGERIGFVARHRLLELTFARPPSGERQPDSTP